MESGGHLGSTADKCLASLNLENVSPKEGVGGSSPSGAAKVLNLKWVARYKPIGRFSALEGFEGGQPCFVCAPWCNAGLPHRTTGTAGIVNVAGFVRLLVAGCL